jgi:hypothetical protein
MTSVGAFPNPDARRELYGPRSALPVGPTARYSSAQGAGPVAQYRSLRPAWKREQ